MINKNRNCAIDTLKFIFAVILVLFHSSLLLTDNMEGSVTFANGAIAVEFYFIVSGFLMAQSNFNSKKTRLDVEKANGFIGGGVIFLAL